ncbi:MAG: DUF1553 domain-containing protein [Planctomycetaceae bacterium]|nr:DUF1553 domain-containing protein [Planctomycetaceae bacterium]
MLSRHWAITHSLVLIGLAASAPLVQAETSEGKTTDQAIVELRVETGREPGQVAVIAGRDGSQQLVVTAVTAEGEQLDYTRRVTYAAAPTGLVEVDSAGHVTPRSEGELTVTAQTAGGVSASTRLRVEHFSDDLPLNFANDVVPLFTKHGCNGGGCHGKASGQNGFRLSLLGFEPVEDFEFLTKEGRGRRLFPAAPHRSLLLMKATGEVPHGGGQRIEPDSPPYRVLHRWVAQGMPFGKDSDPVAIGIDVFPKKRTMQSNAEQQIIVVAHYSDGTSRDVTRMAQLESNDVEMAEVTPSGLVETQQQTGTAAVMCIFQGHVDVFRATLPLGVQVADLPEPSGYVDELVFAQLQELGLPPSELCDDPTFLRRATITIAGRVPTLQEATEFAADSSADKRVRLVNRLLDSNDYAHNFATKWAAILRNKRGNDADKRATYAFYHWIRDRIIENQPYDEFVRDIVAASGEVSIHPPVAWYREVRDQASLVEDTAQLFLGMRIQCARCHHHPFEKWSQRDYHSFSAFYSQVGRKKGEFKNQDRIVHKQGKATAKNPKTGESLLPTGLDAEPSEISPLDDPRHVLVDWMTQPNNPFFAKALVNRYWKHVFGRGLVDPEDDMRVTNPASNPRLLDALAEDFVAHGYDLKYLMRTICSSKTFQLSAEPNEYNQKDKQNYSRYYPSRLNAEILLDAIDQMTGVPTKFPGVPDGTRAIELPDSGFDSYFLTVFGRPESSSACECERSSDASLAQSLHLLNSKDILGKVSADAGRAAKMIDDKRALDQQIKEMYLIAFSRQPDADELRIASDYIQSKENSREGFEDVVWALINTKEFLFNH